jgi:hypothetical protein
MAECLSVLRLPPVWETFISKPDLYIIDITAEDRVYEGAVSGTYGRSMSRATQLSNRKMGITKELV